MNKAYFPPTLSTSRSSTMWAPTCSGTSKKSHYLRFRKRSWPRMNKSSSMLDLSAGICSQSFKRKLLPLWSTNMNWSCKATSIQRDTLTGFTSASRCARNARSVSKSWTCRKLTVCSRRGWRQHFFQQRKTRRRTLGGIGMGTTTPTTGTSWRKYL